MLHVLSKKKKQELNLPIAAQSKASFSPNVVFISVVPKREDLGRNLLRNWQYFSAGLEYFTRYLISDTRNNISQNHLGSQRFYVGQLNFTRSGLILPTSDIDRLEKTEELVLLWQCFHCL